MPRRLRYHVDHVPLHIVQRGHNRERCFFAEADCQRYLAWLHEALTDAECTLHAYVLMSNHVHLLLTPRCAQAVPGAIISLGRRYVQHVNRTYDRTGTLWDSRYKSSLVQSNRYLLACQRYIELNPVRAGIVRDPSDYAWSSYQVHAFGKPNDIVSPHPLYCALGRDGPERQLAYRRLFDELPDSTDVDDIRLAAAQSQPVGDRHFHDAVEGVLGARREARRQGRPGKDLPPLRRSSKV
jgi:putative transposase